ncbi:carbohydrate diacid regulator [Streptomyces sp. cf386]|uniref:CdaR family transcriptional regulator n=1 Tax=Streptomyces sp. cf386 TaxID=1761904 RepID=UPI00088471F0|nr:sugar diacid recognition domain-containing protein [Streptomyces sp. cf386]SDN26381.1 carbohydrate diacid regulator [Streptomyces sp. cf386]
MAAGYVLTPELAQEIACDIGRITGFNVLITDREAVVIGCGDTDRLGTVHEASYEVLRDRRPATHTAEQARRMRGVLSGMSLPITVGAEAVGTVCLTGDPDEVRRFGLVVQRQTEILLEEAALLRSRLLHERAVDDCVRDIALYDPEVVDAETVEARMAELGADPRLPRTAVVLDVRAGGVSRMSLLRTVREVFGSAQDVTGELAAGRYAVLHASTGGPARLVERCSALVERLGERHGAEARAGIGEPGRGVAGLHDSYRDAALALRAGPRLEPDGRVFAVADLRVPQLVASAVRQERARYAAAVLSGLREREDWPVLRETLIAWAEGGFQLVRTAERLAVHRNTLLYRLTKIEELSGREVREPRTAMAMYLACLADAL